MKTLIVQKEPNDPIPGEASASGVSPTVDMSEHSVAAPTRFELSYVVASL